MDATYPVDPIDYVTMSESEKFQMWQLEQEMRARMNDVDYTVWLDYEIEKLLAMPMI